MTDKEILEVINKKLYETGKTQTSLANDIGVATTTLNRFLTGRVTLGLDKVCRLCEKLDIDILAREKSADESLEENSEDSDDSGECTDDEDPDPRVLSKDQYRIQMLKLKGRPGDMEYDSKLYFAYQKLANAIIVMAADDYRELCKAGKLKTKVGSKYTSIDSIEDFFRSDYYKSLTELDGEYLLEKLKEEVNGNKFI